MNELSDNAALKWSLLSIKHINTWFNDWLSVYDNPVSCDVFNKVTVATIRASSQADRRFHFPCVLYV